MASVIPRIGETVALQSQLRHGGQANYRVADVQHYYTDNNARSFDQYVPGVVWIVLEEIPQA